MFAWAAFRKFRSRVEGIAEGRELEILNEIKSEVPPEVFTTEWKNPVNDKDGDYRKHQQEALKLFEAAGWQIKSERPTTARADFSARRCGRSGYRRPRRRVLGTTRASR